MARDVIISGNTIVTANGAATTIDGMVFTGADRVGTRGLVSTTAMCVMTSVAAIIGLRFDGTSRIFERLAGMLNKTAVIYARAIDSYEGIEGSFGAISAAAPAEKKSAEGAKKFAMT